MSGVGYSKAAVARYAVASALVTQLLVSGVTATVRKETPTAAIRAQNVQCVGSGSGSGVCVDGLGNQNGSGSLTIGDDSTGSGKLTLKGADGGKICSLDTDGTGYTVQECNNGTCTPRVATGTECP